MANTNIRSRGGRMNDPERLVLDGLDLAILAALPDVGELEGKYLPKVGLVRDLRQQLDPKTSSGSYGQRLGLMMEAGYVKQVHVRRGTLNGWQRTEKGKQAAAG